MAFSLTTTLWRSKLLNHRQRSGQWSTRRSVTENLRYRSPSHVKISWWTASTGHSSTNNVSGVGYMRLFSNCIGLGQAFARWQSFDIEGSLYKTFRERCNQPSDIVRHTVSTESAPATPRPNAAERPSRWCQRPNFSPDHSFGSRRMPSTSYFREFLAQKRLSSCFVIQLYPRPCQSPRQKPKRRKVTLLLHRLPSKRFTLKILLRYRAYVANSTAILHRNIHDVQNGISMTSVDPGLSGTRWRVSSTCLNVQGQGIAPYPYMS